MGKPKTASKYKMKVELERFCEILLEIDFYQQLGKTSEAELLRLVAVKLFNVSDSVARHKTRVKELGKRCKMFSIHHEKEIKKYFATHFKGPECNFPKKFNLNFNYSDILTSENKFNFNLRNNVFDKFITINSLCILTDKNKYTRIKKPFVILKFKCAFKKCPATYTFTLNNDYINNKSTLNFTVVQTCPILHRKGVDCPRFITKNKRSQIGKLLVNDNLSPDALYYELMPGSEIPEDMLDKEDDIRKFVPSKSVLRKIKCETLKKQKLDQDPFLDLIKFKALQESEKKYFIKEVSYSPLRIFLFYDRMLKIIKLEIKIKKCLDIHLDCTGSLFKKYSEKRAFYYSIALPSVKGNSSLTLCPQISIYDGILSDHTTFSIAHWLNYFVKILEQNTGKTHPVRKVEVDFSWAFLHASVEAFNKTDLKTYLQRSFEVTTKSKLMSDFSFYTVVHIRAAHLIKSV